MDCIGHVQKRMRKRLMNLKATHKEKLADGKTIGGRGRLSDFVIKKIQRYYGFAIWQNVRKGENATEKQKEISMHQMRKNIVGILHHMIKILHNNICIVLGVLSHGVPGSEMLQMAQKHTKTSTVSPMYFLIC